MRRRPPWFKKKSSVEAAKDFVGVKISIPNEQYKFLCKLSESTMLPLSRLISYAVDNERDSRTPFYYPAAEPQTIYVPHAYTDEAQNIFAFIQRFPSGISRDNLLIFRRQFGVPNKSVVLLALRELLEMKLVFETAVKPPGQVFEFGPDHKWIRVKTRNTDVIDRKRKKLEQQKNKIKMAEEKLSVEEFLAYREKVPDDVRQRINEKLERDKQEIRSKYGGPAGKKTHDDPQTEE
jgi:hypothetical protein